MSPPLVVGRGVSALGRGRGIRVPPLVVGRGAMSPPCRYVLFAVPYFHIAKMGKVFHNRG